MWDSSIWGLSTTDPVFPPRFLLDWNLLYFSRWPWSQGCWGGVEEVQMWLLGLMLWCVFQWDWKMGRMCYKERSYFLDLSAHFSLLLPATWDTALSLRHCSHLGMAAWLTERIVQGKQAWRLCLCYPAPIAWLLSGMSYLRMELPPLVAVLYTEFPHAHWIAITLFSSIPSDFSQEFLTASENLSCFRAHL